MIALIVKGPNGATSTEKLTGTSIIGRTSGCDVVLKSGQVSRRHARITITDQECFIEDLASGNGTFVNGERLRRRIALHHGDCIQFGPISAQFVCADFHGLEQPAQAERSATSPTFEIGDEEGFAPRITETVQLEEHRDWLETCSREKLRAILDLSRSLARVLDAEDLLCQVTTALLEIFPTADRIYISSWDEESGDIQPRAAKNRNEQAEAGFRVSRTIMTHAFRERKAIISADVSFDPRFEQSTSIDALSIKSMMCVPLIAPGGTMMGVLTVESLNGSEEFTSKDLDILLGVAGQVAISWTNTLLIQTHVDQQRVEQEMRLAHDVQQAFLPNELPLVANYRFFAHYEAANSVGGDYYDVVQTPEGKFWIAVGDVSGKGFPAALVMSHLSSAMHWASHFIQDITEVLTRMNRDICERGISGKFVTLALMELDISGHTCTLVNAGHPSPIILSADGSLREMSRQRFNLPLGIEPTSRYDYHIETLSAGDALVFYTDGITEAMNSSAELFGKQSLQECLCLGPGTAEQLGSRILDSIESHTNGHPQSDDKTLFVVSRDAI